MICVYARSRDEVVEAIRDILEQTVRFGNTARVNVSTPSGFEFTIFPPKDPFDNKAVKRYCRALTILANKISRQPKRMWL